MTAHDPRVTLTEAEREAITSCDCGHDIGGQHNGLGCYARDYPSPGVTVVCDCPETDDRAGVNYAAVEHIVAEHAAARLAPIRALLDDGPDTWEGYESRDTGSVFLRESVLDFTADLLAALDAPQDAPRGPAGGEQGAEVAGGRSEGERPSSGAFRHADGRTCRLGPQGWSLGGSIDHPILCLRDHEEGQR